jgi:hypothetical protein
MRFQFRNSGEFFTQEGMWILDIGDGDGNPLVCGIPLVVGIDLLWQYEYLKFPGMLFVASDAGDEKPPSFTNLGWTTHLYFMTPPYE